MENDLRALRTYDLILVDAMNLAARSHHGIRVSHNGRPTGMQFGVTRAWVSVKRIYPSARIVFLWEGFNNKRKALHSIYKANRDRSNEPTIQRTEFVNAVARIKELLVYLGCDQMSHVGLEADDLAGHMVASSDKQVLLISNDQDWFQYLEPSRVDIKRRDLISTYRDVEKELGFPPEKITLWKILKGDSSDNIPGIPRIPSAFCRHLLRCDSYEEWKSIRATDPKNKKWLKKVHDNWSLIERNAELILHHPSWINPDDLEVVTGEFSMDKVERHLLEDGMKTSLSFVQEVVDV